MIRSSAPTLLGSADQVPLLRNEYLAPMTQLARDQTERERERALQAADEMFDELPRCAVVTGGTRGVGRELVRELCAQGYQVSRPITRRFG